LAFKILTNLKINPNLKTKELSANDINRLREAIEKNYRVEGDLRREVKANIRRLVDISAYRGIRHMRRLPARGQRTKTNSRTRRGNVRKTVGSGRKKPADKT